jgi:phosphonate degradation associated HDIG domain protein
MENIVDTIITLFNRRGHSEYGGESVSQLEHALQTATHAQQNGAAVHLIAASLLHDIGHILHDLPNEAPDKGIDDLHEALAARFLEKHFGAAVAEPARLHVEAKRYLAAAEPGYLEILSPPSIQSLALQGGPMDEEEQATFRLNPFFVDAVQLRKWDDLAKDPEMVTPPIEAFTDVMKASLKAGTNQ